MSPALPCSSDILPQHNLDERNTLGRYEITDKGRQAIAKKPYPKPPYHRSAVAESVVMGMKKDGYDVAHLSPSDLAEGERRMKLLLAANGW